MAMSLQEQLRAQRAKTERWIHEREAQVRQMAAQAEAKGRQIYARAIKTGQKVVAGTPSELRQLGLTAVQGGLPAAVALKVAQKAASPKTKVVVRPTAASAQSAPSPDSSIRRQVEAGVSGFVDEASFGMADRVLAAGDALRAAARQGHFDDVRRDYDLGLAAKRAQDRYDAEHNGFARNAGKVTGFAASVAAMGAPAVTRMAVSRLPRGAALLRDIAVGAKRGPDVRGKRGPDVRGLTTLAAIGGGASGAGGQVASDFLSGRSSDLASVAGATLGGAAGAVSSRVLGPTTGGAVGGAVTSAASDLLHGRTPSLDNAFAEGRAGAVFGMAGDLAGRNWIAGQGQKIKGEVGELFSRAKTVARGDSITGVGKRVPLRNGKYTVADHTGTSRSSGKAFIGESKMGPSATLTANQKVAKNQLGDHYVLDHWRFSDVGKAAGAGLAPTGANLLDPWYED